MSQPDNQPAPINSTHPRIFRDGWEAAIYGIDREKCPYIDGWGEQAMRKAWLAGYDDALREREKDHAA